MSIHFPGTERDAKPWRRLEAVIALSMADLESKRVMLSHCGRLRRLVERSEVRWESLIA